MAKRRADRDTRPSPPLPHPPKLIPLGTGTFWRVHPKKYRANEFNKSAGGDARFSPIHQSNGQVIPVLYAASSLSGALMETVLHDVPTPPNEYILDLDALRDQNLVVSSFRPKQRLKVVDLSTKGLKRLGLERTDLVDTSVTEYSRTRQWAEWLHANCAGSGLLWTSRQDDTARATVLFGDRTSESALSVTLDRQPLSEDIYLDALLQLAEHIGIRRVIGF